MNQKIKDIALNVLHRNYPVSRLKVNKKFRRAIMCDNGIAYPLDRDHKLVIKNQLVKSLYSILSFEPTILISIVDGYLDN
jgi:hypothetical protein